MRRMLWLSAILLITIVLLVGGCGSPEAIKPLTDDEKNEMVEMALAHPEVSKWLDEADVYSTEVGWVVIAWGDSRAVGWYRMDYEDIKDGEPPSDIAYVTDDVTINPQLYISVGEPARLFISVIFNQDRKEVLTVELQPGRPTAGPTPPQATESKSVRWLTEEEKARVTEIALNSPEAKEARESYGVYRTSLRWVAIKQNESGGLSLWGFDYEMVDSIPDNVPKDAKFYSQAEILFGEPEQLLMRIAVDLENEKVVHVDSHGLKILPR